jgi:hypothetical protein
MGENDFIEILETLREQCRRMERDATEKDTWRDEIQALTVAIDSIKAWGRIYENVAMTLELAKKRRSAAQDIITAANVQIKEREQFLHLIYSSIMKPESK